MALSLQRVVIVTRMSPLDWLIQQHGSKQQAAFFLRQRDQTLQSVADEHAMIDRAKSSVLQAISSTWRRSLIDRNDLDRFLFEPEDIVIALGQDGLVANVAKYLERQFVIGVNPIPQRFDGVLVPFAPDDVAGLLRRIDSREASWMERTKVTARLDNGLSLTALNELYLGHATHQSSRYEIQFDKRRELQSSSGVIVATGTGATGWARSIHRQSQSKLRLPRADEKRLIFFTREAWPSATTQTEITSGTLIRGRRLTIVSRMNEGGVVFGDGLELDRLPFEWGSTCRLEVNSIGLRCIAPVRTEAPSRESRAVTPAMEDSGEEPADALLKAV